MQVHTRLAQSFDYLWEMSKDAGTGWGKVEVVSQGLVQFENKSRRRRSLRFIKFKLWKLQSSYLSEPRVAQSDSERALVASFCGALSITMVGWFLESSSNVLKR